MELPPPVTLKSLKWVTPTMAETLSRCMLSAAFRADPAYNDLRRSSVPAILGTVSHKLAERVARGDMDGVSTHPEDALLGAWEELISEGHRSLQVQSELGNVPQPTYWPGYQLVKVRTLRRLEEELSARGEPGSGRAKTVIPEQRLEDAATQVAGTPDRVEITPDGVEIVDLKSGWRVSDQLSDSHRRQLLLYAYLWHAVHGEWPVRASVQRLDGKRVTMLVHPAEAMTEAQEASRLLARFNALVGAAERKPDELARPSAATCGSCSFRGACQPFLREPSATWSRLRTFGGEVSALERGQDRAILELSDVVGGVDSSTVRVVAPSTLPAVEIQTRCVLMDAIPVTERDFRVDWETRLLIGAKMLRNPGGSRS